MNARVTRRAFLQAVVCVITLPKTVFSREIIREHTIPVLLYHDISYEIKDDYTITPGLFAAQMEWLYQKGYKAVSLDEAGSASSNDNTVIITFDDGYASFVNYAFPVLRTYNFKATINIIGKYVNAFMDDRVVRPMLSWDEYRYLAASGLISLGCHTDHLHNFRHKGVIGVSEESLLNDLKGFQDRFAREMGAASDIIAWPYGFYNNKSISAAQKAGFRYILTSDAGLYKSSGESTKIPRTNINEQNRLFDFQSALGAM